MKSPATSGLRGKSRVDSSKQNPTVVDAVVTGSSDGRGATDAQAHIAALAYALYEQRGRRDGQDVEDWLMAEQRVLGQSNAQTAEHQRP